MKQNTKRKFAGRTKLQTLRFKKSGSFAPNDRDSSHELHELKSLDREKGAAKPQTLSPSEPPRNLPTAGAAALRADPKRSTSRGRPRRGGVAAEAAMAVMHMARHAMPHGVDVRPAGDTQRERDMETRSERP